MSPVTLVLLAGCSSISLPGQNPAEASLEEGLVAELDRIGDDLSDEQAAVLEDDLVTFEEYEGMYLRFAGCVREEGIPFNHDGFDEFNSTFQYGTVRNSV